MRRLILKNQQAPGDILMLTAAVRDLHRCHPGEFQTDVRTRHPDLWRNNKHITPLQARDSGVETIACHYPLIRRSNREPYHFIHGFIQHLNGRLGTRVRPTAFKGDIHLSAEERQAPSMVQAATGCGDPFWIIVAGGKFDFTIKWWETARYQAVVDHFRDRIGFVQVGDKADHHPRLEGVVDLRGETTLRELVLLVHHAQGILCPVTCLMHLAAAVESRPGRPANRPCVVVAGGREPPHWEAYPFHQFIHTVGALPCCARGGCWRSRTEPIGDGDRKDRPRNLCKDVVGHLPRCMDMITPDDVIRRIEAYFSAGVCSYLEGAPDAQEA